MSSDNKYIKTSATVQINPPFVLENFRQTLLSKVGNKFAPSKHYYQPLDEAADLITNGHN